MGARSKGRADDDRRLRLAAIREEQARAERRRRTRFIALTVALVLLLAVPTVVLVSRELRRDAVVEQEADEPIEGERVVDVPSATHVGDEVPYETSAPSGEEGTALPPLGGDHDQVLQNCGFYSEAVRDENAVHSLEHGAVWLTYREDLAGDQVERLEALAADASHLLVSPYPDLAAPVVATAWGVQLELESVDDERLEPFLARYVQGAQTPEPGAPCSGGVGG